MLFFKGWILYGTVLQRTIPSANLDDTFRSHQGVYAFVLPQLSALHKCRLTKTAWKQKQCNPIFMHTGPIEAKDRVFGNDGVGFSWLEEVPSAGRTWRGSERCTH